MRIAYLGNKKYPWCTEVHIAATLRMMGHDVRFLQEDETSAQDVPELSAGCDLFLWTRTEGFLQGDGHRMLSRLRELHIPSVSYHLDLYVGLQRGDGLKTDPFWRTDHVFTPDGDPSSLEVFRNLGINHHWLMPAVYGPECVDGKVDQRFVSDVGFVGTVEQYHSEWRHRPELIGALDLRYGRRFRRWPMDQPAVRGQDLNNLYASVKVVVGDTLCLNYKHQNYWSDRITETLGRGGFLIHPWIKGLDEYFTDGVNVAFYQYGEFFDLMHKIDYYLEHPEEREQIRLAGQALVREEHTYRNRLEEVLEVVL